MTIRLLLRILALGYLISRIDALIQDVRHNKRTIGYSPTILNLYGTELILRAGQTQLVKHYRRTKTTLFDRYSDLDDKPGLSLKVVLLGGLLGVGVFGTSFVGTVQTVVKDFTVRPASTTSLKKPSYGESASRGAMTRLTRREINGKLSQLPVFFAENENGGIFTQNGIGYIFIDASDAEAFSKKQSTKVSATSLDSVFYTLIQKKTKLSSYVEGVSRNSDPDASYRLVASRAQVENTPSGWDSKHADDVPLFRIPNLAFSKEEGIELPLFVRKEDAVNAYDRLQASKKGNGERVDSLSSMNLQVISLQELVEIFSTGGFESRAFEIYPDIGSIENARKLVT